MDEPRKRSDKKKSKQSKDLDDAHVSVSVSESEERRLKKELKRAKKMGERLAELGLDENGEPLDNFSLLKYPVREWKISIPGSRGDQVAFNPVVTMVGMIGLWILVMFCTCKFCKRSMVSTCNRCIQQSLTVVITFYFTPSS